MTRIKKISIRGLLVIQYQILRTNIIRIVWKTVRRLTDEILRVTELIYYGGNSSESSEKYFIFQSGLKATFLESVPWIRSSVDGFVAKLSTAQT